MTPSRQPSSLEHAVLLLGDADERLVRDEHDHEVGRRLELAPVRLLRELAEMVAHLTRVIGEIAVADVFVLRLAGVQVGGERGLGIDDDLLAARDPDDEVGPQQGALGVARRRLLLEVAVGEQAGRLDDVPELHLAPAAAHVRRPQRLDEVAGLEPEALLRARKRVQMLGDGAVRLLAHLLHPAHLAVHPLERVLQRRHVPAQLGLRDLQKRRARLPERLGGERLEGVPRLGDDRGPLVACPAEQRELGLELRRAAPGHHPGAAGAEEETEDESENDHRADER